MDPDPKALLECAVAAAQASGRHALENADRRQEVISATRHDIKLALDLECQRVAEEVVRSHFPAHAILGEENTGTASGAEPDGTHLWIIDPIDGTVNFSHGLPFWCCSIAARRGADVVAATVYAPDLDELYTAAQGGRALCNERILGISGVKRLGDAMVMTGMDKGVDPRLPPFALSAAIAGSAQKARIMGCAALDMCRVALGQADAYFESGIYVWDAAAAGLIVKQAGGMAEVLKEQSEGRLMFLASNGYIHEELKRVVMGVL